MASPLKRNAPIEFNDVDSENMDPLLFLSPSKKARDFDFDSSMLTKPPHFTLTPSTTTTINRVDMPKFAGQKRKAEDSSVTPNTCTRRCVETASAPAPAGRSPKHKRAGILSRRRATAGPFTRINPPSFSPTEAKSGLPFSIDAALAGTVPLKLRSKPKSTSRLPTSTGVHFHIHEDSPEKEKENLMEHSACTLVISDDEGRRTTEDCENKENIPPVDYRTTPGAPVTRRDMMTDEDRSPLGDLNAKDFYAEGCDASSFVIIPAEESGHEGKPTLASNVQPPCSTLRPRTNAVAEGHQSWDDLLAQVAVKSSAIATNSEFDLLETTKGEPAEIQIWESESAKGDDETDHHDLPVDSTGEGSIS